MSSRLGGEFTSRGFGGHPFIRSATLYHSARHGTGQTVGHATCDPEFLFLVLIERNDLAAFPNSDRHSLRQKNCTIQNNLKAPTDPARHATNSA